MIFISNITMNMWVTYEAFVGQLLTLIRVFSLRRSQLRESRYIVDTGIPNWKLRLDFSLAKLDPRLKLFSKNTRPFRNKICENRLLRFSLLSRSPNAIFKWKKGLPSFFRFFGLNRPPPFKLSNLKNVCLDLGKNTRDWF